MVYRTIIDPMEQMRDFDFVSFEHDVLVGMGALAADIMSGLPNTVVGGLAATQSNIPSLTFNIAAGRIYQFAQADAVADGSIAQDLTVIAQQGELAPQTLTLVAPSAGQSQWNLVQAQFSQQDAVRANDPNGGIVPFYNASNPSQPTLNSINTVRKALCVLQVITGSAATTGSESPPTPTSGWVPLYLIDLTGGQSQVTTSQILRAGPSVGTGVPANYAAAPFLGGLLASHHSGAAGQAPKVNLATEVQGVLPYINMSPVRVLLNAPLTLYVNTGTGADTNTGLSPSVPFKTIQGAVNAAYHNYDFNGNALSISIANGTYNVTNAPNAPAVSLSGLPLACPLVNLVGNVASPGSVTLAAAGGIALRLALGATATLAGMTITASGSNQGVTSYSGYGITLGNGALLNISNCVIGSCGSAQMDAETGSSLIMTGPMTFTGTTIYAVMSQLGSLAHNIGNSVTVTGLTVTGAFVLAADAGTQIWSGNTFVGTATGPKFLTALNGIINVSGAGANYFPGSTAGVIQTGGQYA